MRNTKRMRTRNARHPSLIVSISSIKKMTVSPAEKEKKGLIFIISSLLLQLLPTHHHLLLCLALVPAPQTRFWFLLYPYESSVALL